MTAKEGLIQQYRFLYRTIAANLEAMTEEESILQPAPGGNCANWILGHLIVVQNNALALLGEPPIIQHENLPRGQQGPVTGPENAIPFDEARTRFLASEDRFIGALAGLGEGDLQQAGFTDPFGDSTTKGGLLNLIAFHQAYHAGQLGLSRRLVGREGAIKAPGAGAAA